MTGVFIVWTDTHGDLHIETGADKVTAERIIEQIIAEDATIHAVIDGKNLTLDTTVKPRLTYPDET